MGNYVSKEVRLTRIYPSIYKIYFRRQDPSEQRDKKSENAETEIGNKKPKRVLRYLHTD